MRTAFPDLDPHIERREDRKGYETPAGTLPSVTTILGETSPPETKARLEAWLKRRGAAEESARACKRGSWVHEQLENHLSGKEVKRHLAFNGYLKSMMPWVEANVVEPLAMEKPVWHPGIGGVCGFSGTFDLLAYCADWPEVTLIDWKTSKRQRSADLVDNYLDQLGAYSLAIAHTYSVTPSAACLVIGRPTGMKPDVWRIDADELEFREQKFLKRAQHYHRQMEVLTACA